MSQGGLTPALVLDIVLIGVIVLTALRCCKRGFAASALGFTGSLMSLLLAGVVSQSVSPKIFEGIFKEGLLQSIAQTLQQQGTAGLASMVENLSGILPKQLAQGLSDSLQQLLGSGGADAAVRIVDSVMMPLIVPLITVVLFFAVFAVCKVLLSMLTAMLSGLNSIPLLGKVNQALGLVVGFADGMVNAVILLCLLWGITAITNNSLPVLNSSSLAGSLFYHLFSAYNPFV